MEIRKRVQLTKEDEMIMNQKRLEVNIAFDRLMRIKRKKRIRKLKNFLILHKN